MDTLLNIFILVMVLPIRDGLTLPSSDETWHDSRRIEVGRNATSDNNDTIIAIKDDTLVLKCEFHVSGWFTIQWVKFALEDEDEDGTPSRLPTDSTSTNDSISTATFGKISADDNGRYRCILATLSGVSESYNFQVVVKKKPSCYENTCSLNGVCGETNQGYSCKCYKGFIGDNCEMADPCSSLPCLNNGSCTTHGDGYNCSCEAGFDGAVCEREVCSGNVCGYGATCRIIDGKRHCTCPYNRAGDRCQYSCRLNSYYCGRTTCLISFRNGRQREDCRCDNNRRQGGQKCMMSSDVRNECSEPRMCNGRGNCYDQVFGYRCDCYSYAHGTNCELYNECSSGTNLCRVNGGTCVDLTVGYKCRDCPNGQTGDKCQYNEHPCKVTCQSTSMIVECDMRFLSSKLRNIPIYTNIKSESCRFRNTESRSYGYNRYDSRRYRPWRMTISYKACATETEYHDDYVTYRNRLRAGGSGHSYDQDNTIITRKAGQFAFKMECTLPLMRNTTKQLTDYSLRLNETKDLEDSKNIGITGTYIRIYKNANYTGGEISSYVVGDRLYAKMTINANSNPTLSRGYQLYPVTCFATSDMNGDDEKYVLLEDRCILDDTFRFENEPDFASQGREAFFSFESFSFKSNPGKLYLHCKSLACVKPKPQTTSNDTCDVTCKNTNESTMHRPTTASVLTSTEPPSSTNGRITRAPGSNVNVFTLVPGSSP